MRENRASHLQRSDEKLILSTAPVGVRTHDLLHTTASNMGKVSYALTQSTTAAVNNNNNNNNNDRNGSCLTWLATS